MKSSHAVSPPVPHVLLLLERTSGYDRTILDGIAAYARNRGGWRFVNHRSREITPHRLRELQVDGIVALDELPGKLLQQQKVPVVLLAHTQSRMSLPCVTCDDEQIAALAADHLADLGIDSFAYAGFAHRFRSTLRYEAFVRSLHRRGRRNPVPVCNDVRFGSDIEEHVEGIARWLKDLPKPCGLFCFNDNIAEGMFEAIIAAGIRVPDEIAVVGVDNDEAIADFTWVPLTSIDPDGDRIGYEAAALLDQLMAGHVRISGSKPVQRLIPPIGVIPRSSTDADLTADPAVAAALRFIRTHGHSQPLRVSDVVAATRLSRATLFRRFARATGQSIAEVIDRQRLAQVTRYLKQTDLPMARIAVECGFPDPASFSSYVRRRLGAPPSSLRRASVPKPLP